MPERLTGTVQRYAWGSKTAIPEFLGVDPDGEPQAELWLGTHPVAPSTVERDGRQVRLDVELPFLVKVLAAAEPLSLQAHPDRASAVAGFDREQALKVPLSASQRVYRDRSHKPELLCALEPFEALCGFRPVAQTLELVDRLGVRSFAELTAPLRVRPDARGLREVMEAALGLARDSAVVAEVVAASTPTDLARRLAAFHPGDPGILVALLLNEITLQSGEALFLDSGNLHAYLRGTGVEVMASSDNVLRGGLTVKHVDIDELLAVVDTTPAEPVVLRPDADGVYPSGAEEFSLRVVEGDATVDGPAIVVCVDGRAEVDGLVIERGQAAWIGADEATCAIRSIGRAYQVTIARQGVDSGVAG